MFWGRGDSSKLSVEEKAELEKLRRLAETGHIVTLSPEQTEIALAAIKLYGTVSATSGLLVGARNVCIWVAGLVMFFWTFKDSVTAILRGIVLGGG